MVDSIIQAAFEKTYAPSPAMSGELSAEIQNEFGLDVKEARIVVVGAGGAGNNCVTRLTEMGIKGATTVIMNTDVKHLAVSKAHKKLLIGRELTRGLGAGGYPDVGKKAAEESEKEIRKMVEPCDMLYLVCGMGGGTGTGAAPEQLRSSHGWPRRWARS